jgi:iron complex outermembrane receptor protein
VDGFSANCVDYAAAADGCSGAWTYLSYVQYYYLGTFATPDDNWWHGTYDDTLEQMAVFGEVTFEVTENFSITAGGRWFDVEQDRRLQNGFGVANPNQQVIDCGDPEGWDFGNGTPQEGNYCYTNEVAKSSENGFVPKVNVSWHVQDDKMLYVTYSEGFRRGGVNAAKPISVFGPGGELHEFDSDLLKNYEVGAKTTWAGGRFQFNIAAYHMKWEDIQIEAEDPTEGLFTLGVVNFPEAEIDGFEADFTWIPTAGLAIGGTVGYNDATLSKTASLFEGSSKEKVAERGTRLPISPKWKGSFYAEYTWNNRWLGAMPYARADFTFQDDSVSSLEGIQSIEFDNPVRVQDGYEILDLRVGLEAEEWTLSLFVDNVTNEFARQFFNDRWAQSRLSVSRPRTVGLTFRRYFGR